MHIRPSIHVDRCPVLFDRDKAKTTAPIDYQNTFNLALYHLTAANPEESDRLYTRNLTAPIEWLEMAISDLDDFLHLFPDHPQAQQVKQRLQGAIDATQPIAL